jgi:hypothetical protein
MHGNVPVRFGRGRLDSLGNKGLAAYLIGSRLFDCCSNMIVHRMCMTSEDMRMAAHHPSEQSERRGGAGPAGLAWR